MEKFTDFLLRYRVFILILSVFLLFYGFYSLKKISIDAIPDLTDVQVIIYAEWLGQSPQIIEDQLTYPISSNMLGLPKVKAVRAFSTQNYSLIYVIFQDNTDIYWARSRVIEKLATIKEQIPPQAKIELGPDATGVGWIYQYIIISNDRPLEELWKLQNFTLKYALLSVPNVAEVATVGGFEKEYRVIINPNKFYIYKINIEDLTNAISKSNLSKGGKYIEINEREFIVSSNGYIKSKNDLENIVVKEINGIPIKLKDIANVIETPALRMGTTDYNGFGNVVSGIVIMRHNSNAFETIKKVKEKINEIQKTLPADIKIVPVYDRSNLIENSINTLKHILMEEIIVLFIIIIIFLLHFTASFVIIIFLILSVLITFIIMNYLGITSNIMSLGGIAIAIGTMVDAGIVLVEATWRKLEENKTLYQAIIEASSEVGKPIFFALIIVAISFIPMLALTGQSGRLFSPLVLTKTISMFVASILSLIVIPVFMYYFMRGKLIKEDKHPIIKILIKIYEPIFKFSIKFRYLIIIFAILMGVSSFLLYRLIGNEFMPELKEGSLLYMPTTIPGISIQEAQKLITIQDKIIKSFPEVESVFAKAGRADTPTDPAPLSMIETIITLKPQSEWRKGMNYEKLIGELDKALRIPGVVNSWTQPIKGRIDMITTGIRTPLGIKVFGDDLEKIEEISKKIESIISNIDGISTVYSERSSKTTFIEITPKREKLYQYGLTVDDFATAIDKLFGNSPISKYINNRERYNITIGIPRDYRKDIENIILPIPDKYIPLKAVAEIRKKESFMEIKSENGVLVGYILISPKPDTDIKKIIDIATKKIDTEISFPKGYYYNWSGEFEYWKEAEGKLKLIIPLVLILIILIVYLTFGNIKECIIVILTLPVSLFGGFLLMYLMNYKLSLASISGFLALLGISAEMSILMLIYIINAYKYEENLEKAIYIGAVKRIRPKVMTMLTIIFTLVPATFSKGTGAEVIAKIATPMLGGVITAFFTALFIIPALYYFLDNTNKKGITPL